MSPLMVGVSGVRGIVGPEFHPLLVARWAAAFAEHLSEGSIVLGRDSRGSGGLFASVAAAVLRSCGRDVWDLAIVPTPTVQVAVEEWKAAGGLILTASHNPAQWNALKFVGGNGSFLSVQGFASLRERAAAMEPGSFLSMESWGRMTERGREALELHRNLVVGRIDADAIRRRRPRVLLDCIHGAAGVLLPDLMRDLGAEVTVLHEEPHGLFPRDPEPTGAALHDLAEEAGRIGAEFALAVDPDVDRCAVVVPGCEIIGEEWTLPLVAQHLLRSRKGPIVTNLSTSTRLDAVAALHGCTVERTPVGEAHVVGRMREIGAVLGGEGNGGVIDPMIHFGRDAAVAAAWLLEAHAMHPAGLKGLAKGIPERYVLKTKVTIQTPEGVTTLVDLLSGSLGVPGDTRDGARWAFPGGFLHVRGSATEPIVRAVAEMPSEAGAQALIDRVAEAGAKVRRG